MSLYPTEDWKKEICEIFFSRIWVVVSCTALIFAGSVAVVMFSPRTYEASGSVLMRSKGQPVRPSVVDKDPNERDMPVSKEDMATELEVITSSALLERTVKELGVTPETSDQDTPYAYGILNPPSEDQARLTKPLNRLRQYIIQTVYGLKTTVAKPESPYAGALQDIRNHMNAEVVPLSSVIRVTLTGNSKDQVEHVLNTMLNEYIVYRGEVYNPNLQDAFFREQTEQYQHKINDLESKLADGGTSTSVSLLEKEIQNNLQTKGKLREEVVLLRGVLAETEQTIKPLSAAVKSSDVQFFSFLENPSINYLGSKVADTVAEREKVLRDFLPDSTRVKVIDESILSLNERLKHEAERIMDQRLNRLDSMHSRMNELDDMLGEMDAKNEALQRQSVQARQQERELEFLLQSFQTFAKRKESVELELAIRHKNFSADVSILSDANYSSDLLYPRKIPTLLLGLIIGFITGCSLGFLFEYLDHTLKRPGEVERYTGLPVIGSIRKFS